MGIFRIDGVSRYVFEIVKTIVWLLKIQNHNPVRKKSTRLLLYIFCTTKYLVFLFNIRYFLEYPC